ncbi:protein of unknown function [Methylorubrum extorquens DM4]|uniref:Uncharacterized protein n=1 Tax=Methylorubrum extorquens (strain DSM 6343 / CIP 106787 / DM4) TaxID=661410 RepID=C7C813_METED|nr:protein of unknown function [Methylorubrum extorquens DM4]
MFRDTEPNARAGTADYELAELDLGCAADDTEALGRAAAASRCGTADCLRSSSSRLVTFPPAQGLLP